MVVFVLVNVWNVLLIFKFVYINLLYDCLFVLVISFGLMFIKVMVILVWIYCFRFCFVFVLSFDGILMFIIGVDDVFIVLMMFVNLLWI